MKLQLFSLIGTMAFALSANAAPQHGGGGAPAHHPAPAFHAAPVVHQAPAPRPSAVVHQAPAFRPAAVVHQAPAPRPAAVVHQAPAFRPAAVAQQAPVVHAAPFIHQSPRPAAVAHQAPAFRPAAAVHQSPGVISRPAVVNHAAPAIHTASASSYRPANTHVGPAATSTRFQQTGAAFTQAPFSTRAQHSPAIALQSQTRSVNNFQRGVTNRSFANAPFSSRQGRGYANYGYGYGRNGGYGYGRNGGHGYGNGGYGYPYNWLGGLFVGGYGYPYNSFGNYGYPYNWLGSSYGSGYPQSFFDNPPDPNLQQYSDPMELPPQDPPPAAQPVNVESGLKVTEVGEGTAAQVADLRPNDIIIAVGETRVRTFNELQAALAQANGPVDIIFINAESGKTERLPVTPVDGKIGASVVPVELK